MGEGGSEAIDSISLFTTPEGVQITYRAIIPLPLSNMDVWQMRKRPQMNGISLNIVMLSHIPVENILRAQEGYQKTT